MNVSPYPGLRPFRQDENEIFFGRDEQVAALLDKLAQQHFLAVIAPSGYGKSSLVRTGLLNALSGGMLPQAGSYWRIADIHPANAPFQQLATGLLRESCLRADYAETLGSTDEEKAVNLPLLEESLHRRLLRGAYSLHEIWQQGAAQRPAGTKLLILADQFEELFRYAKKISADESAAFSALLLAAAQHPDIYVILTMRTDFLGHCARFEKLPEAVSQGLYLVPKMDRDQLQEAIEGPAEMFGGEIEPALLNRMLNDLSGQQDQLPLLQHCLMRLWHQAVAENENTAHCLSLQAYEQLGGLRRALSDHAGEAYAELNPVQQRQAKIMFQALTEQEGGLDTRRPETVGIIAQIFGQDWQVLLPVIAAFRQQGRNFITATGPSVQFGGTGQQDDLSEATLLDISHESLIRQWRRLQEWTKEEAQSAETYRRLCQTAVLRQKGKAELLRGVELAAALDWQKQNQPTAAWAGRYSGDFQAAMEFLQQSKKEKETAKERETKKHRRIFMLLMSGMIIVSVLAGVSLYYWRQARMHLQLAEKNEQFAVQQNETTLQLIDSFMEVVPKLAGTGTNMLKDRIMNILQDNLADLKKYNIDTERIQRAKSYNLIMIGSLLSSLGDKKKALETYYSVLNTRRNLAGDDKATYRERLDLAIIYRKIGEVQAQLGRTEETLERYQQALKILDSLPSDDISTGREKLNLAGSYRKFGEMQAEAGRSDKALRMYGKSFDILKNTRNAPANLEEQAQWELAVNYRKIGNAMVKDRNYENALKQYEKELDILKLLFYNASDYAKDQAKWDLAGGYRRLGDTQAKLGRNEEALKLYQEELAIRQPLVDAAPENKKKERTGGVTYTYDALGSIMIKLVYNDQSSYDQNHIQDKLREAEDFFLKALSIAPAKIIFLEHDMELAWLQDDTARCRQRIATLDNLLKPEDRFHSIVRFYEWLLKPESSWQPLLSAIESAGEAVRPDWNFSTILPKIQQLPDRRRQAAEVFIEYFEGKINLNELRPKLDKLQAAQVPIGGQ